MVDQKLKDRINRSLGYIGGEKDEIPALETVIRDFLSVMETRGIASTSRRDWLAGLAMQGLLAADSEFNNGEEIAAWAYNQADAMIEEGKKATT